MPDSTINPACPFCGATDPVIIRDPTEGAYEGYVVSCSCTAMGPVGDTREEAWAEWCRRVTPPAQGD